MIGKAAASAFLRSFSSRVAMDLHVVVDALNKIAPVKLAEKWDNVGLLIEPSAPHNVERIFLTNDLTEGVLDEALKERANMIISYHPPLFRSFKRLTAKSWKERIAVKALENRIAIYSPHTSSDSVERGVNDWLAQGLGKCSEIRPIRCASAKPTGGLVACAGPTPALHKSMKFVSADSDTHLLFCKDGGVNNLVQSVVRAGFPSEKVQAFQPMEIPLANTGQGRLCTFGEPVELSVILQRVKDHLNLKHLRIALGRDKTLNSDIRTVALVAGSGGSVLSGCDADVFLTGEMSHHEILDATQSGRSVILCEHSNTERGYLHVLKQQLIENLKFKEDLIIISKVDKDPIDIM